MKRMENDTAFALTKRMQTVPISGFYFFLFFLCIFIYFYM